ncbi:dihydrolipoyl dehydrogenase [Patulibacter sp. SYSU D01012]|uniref:dihydrolipoyl dehydrogenase n=1 Tax=Patulibacter sp. SYSU D01012 TaxID=2817381 RepID=UPI001B30840B|nr:dihydrolipoyl dehydrogenase [Patulibacter sp. SYSU D01012]
MAQYDTIVIGSGPGGYVAAIRAAQLGLKTLVVEKAVVGGRCPTVACIPAKVVLRSADILTEARDAGDFGLNIPQIDVDFGAISERRKKVIGQLTGGVAQLLKKNGIEYLEGEASLDADGGVVVNGETHSAAKGVILATGSVRRAIPGVEYGGRVIGTEEAWAFEQLPGSVAVIGAGASGTEIASAYARLGSQVQLFEFLDRVLPSEDVDISRVANREFKKQGIDVHVGTKVADVQSSDTGVTFTFQKGDGEKQQGQADYLVIATGRGPDVAALGLDAAGVELDDRGLIKVDGRLRTSKKGVWAIGDLVPGPALAHKASDEGVIAAEDIAGQETHPISYVDVPRATFCKPNVASFGLTEAQAKEQGYDVVVGKVPYGAVGGGTVYGEAGTIKIVGDKKYGEILGGHIVGAKATEMIQELVNAKALEGGYPEVARSVHGHPTISEAVMEAARAADGWLIHG